MLNHIKLTNVGPAESLRFDFAPRLNIITGDNGLGKSFILDVAWWALTANWAGKPAAPRAKGATIKFSSLPTEQNNKQITATYDHQLLAQDAWQRVGTLRPPGVLVYVQVDGSFAIFDHHYESALGALAEDFVFNKGTLGLRPWRGATGHTYNARTFRFQAAQVWDGLREDGRILCNGLITDWGNWLTRKPEIFEQFESVLHTLSARDSESMRPGPLVRTAIDDVRDIPTLEMPYGQVPITQVSAGMKRILGIAYLLVWSWHEHRRVSEIMGMPPTSSIVLLIDEIEAHLHPQWQRRILPAIHQAAKALAPEVDIQILAVTHSPLVLASMETEFDPEKDALFKFDLDGDNKVTVDKMKWRPRGDVSSWLTSEIFGLGQARSIEAERAIEKAMAAMRDPTLPIDKVREIHHELHSVLKDFDPFWPRWLVRAAAAGVDP